MKNKIELISETCLTNGEFIEAFSVEINGEYLPGSITHDMKKAYEIFNRVVKQKGKTKTKEIIETHIKNTEKDSNQSGSHTLVKNGGICKITNDKLSWVLEVDKKTINFVGIDNADYFGELYAKLGYEIVYDRDKWKKD